MIGMGDPSSSDFKMHLACGVETNRQSVCVAPQRGMSASSKRDVIKTKQNKAFKRGLSVGIFQE